MGEVGGGGGKGGECPYAICEQDEQKGPDEHAHPCSLIRLFSIRQQIL